MNFILCSELHHSLHQNVYQLRLGMNGAYVIDVPYNQHGEETEESYILSKGVRGNLSMNGFITPKHSTIKINDNVYQCYCITVKVVHDITLFDSDKIQITILGYNTRVVIEGETFTIREVNYEQDIREPDDDTSEVW